MSDELNLPYAPSKLTHQCPHDVLVPDMPGVRVTGEIVGEDDVLLYNITCYCLLAYDVDEETLKGLVFNYGAVQTSIRARENSFKRYKGGMSIINLFYH